MAMDSNKIYINRLKEIRNPITNCLLEEEIFINGLTGFQYVPDSNNSYLSAYVTDINGIHIKYQPYRNKGELRIKFNIPKLMAGTNICSIYVCNIHKLFKKLCLATSSLINLSAAPHLRFWQVSEFECNADIIMSIAEIEALYSVLRKTASTNKYKLVKHYDTGGKTLYFVPKKAKLESSDIVIKIYLKLPEMKEHDKEFNLQDIYDSKGIINLKPGGAVLRIEVTIYRDLINQYFKLEVFRNNYFKGSCMEISKLGYKMKVGTFEQVFNYEYQSRILKDILSEFNLDKIITTKDELYKLINSMDFLSDERKREGRKVIQYLNKAWHKEKPDDNDIKYFKDLILKRGFNYMYSDIEIGPITLEGIISGLPPIQRSEIERYKESSIYEDILLSSLPNPRVYKGKQF